MRIAAHRSIFLSSGRGILSGASLAVRLCIASRQNPGNP